jgi:hypothetical protein
MKKPETYTIRFPETDGAPGDHGSIAMKDKDWKVFQKEVGMEGRVQIEAAMRAWCRFGPANIPDKRFKFETRYESGGKGVRIDAFKGRHVRLYGATVEVDGKPMFLVTGRDMSKKTNAADQELLKAAGKTAFKLIHG